MSTGDPTNLFTNLLIFYAMYIFTIVEKYKDFKKGFLRFSKIVVYTVTFICALGWLDIITMKEVYGQYYLVFSEDMRLGSKPLLNLHLFFMVLAVKMVIFAAYEWLIGLNTDINIREYDGIQNKKGA